MSHSANRGHLVGSLRTYTAAEAAEVLKVTPFEVTRLCRKNIIPASKPGKSWIITEADLLAFIGQHRNQAASA